MNPQEFSTEFDVLFNNVTSNQAPGLNEYEKSVFLTKAQAQLVNEYFNQRTDGFGGGFDGSQKRQYDFSSITRIENLFEVNSFGERITSTEKLDRRSKVFLFPQDYFLAVNEILSDDKWQYSVTPISHSEYQRLMLKPYNFPVKRGAWRIITNKKSCNCVHEDSEGNPLGEVTVDGEYRISTTYNTQGKKLGLNIETNGYWDTSYGDYEGDISLTQRSLRFITNNGFKAIIKVSPSNSWNDNGIIKPYIEVIRDQGTIDDASAIDILKEGALKAKNSNNWNLSYDIIKALDLFDGFAQAEVPNQLYTFQGEGRTFEFSTSTSSTIELIGKFSGPIQYQLRYIRSLTPIILEDLDNYGTDLTIDGVTKTTPCVLPQETHQEILERAVTLAKIAWQGGTMTGAAQQQAKNG